MCCTNSLKITLKNSQPVSNLLKIFAKGKNPSSSLSIDYFNENYGVLSLEPLRADSMIFSSSLVKNVDQNELKYFYFFKHHEKVPKKKTDSTYQPSPYERAIANLSHEDKILQKNLKILLNQCDFIE